jgi:predicted ATP-grasp superfamily ATP-dependent carboligase
MRKPYAVINKLDSIAGLQASRILSGYGIPVIGIADDPRNFCCRTNTCERVLKSETSGEGLVDTLIKLGRETGRKSALFSCSDDSVLTVSAHRERLGEYYGFVLPEHETVELLTDKVRLYEYLEGKGFPVPPTYIVRSEADARNAAGRISYPCIAKPPRLTKDWLDCFKYKAVKISNSAEFHAVSDKGLNAGMTLVVQEWIEGTDSNIYQFYYYFDRNGVPVLNHTSRKLRQWPVELGEASLVESCASDPVPRESVDIFSGLNYRGMVSLELKIDEKSGRCYIIEPDTGRPNTSVALAEASGLPMLYTMYCDALGMPLPEPTAPKPRRAKWISLTRDLIASGAYFNKGRLTFRDWADSLRGINTFAVFSLKDPVPFFADIFGLFTAAFGLQNAGRRGQPGKVPQKSPV